MRPSCRWKIRATTLAAAGALAASVAGYAAPADASAARSTVRTAAAAPLQTGGVSPTAASGTPELAGKGSANVRQLVQCASTMYAVGKFTSISQDGTLYNRDNIFSFSATAPYKMTSWAPDVDGEVNSISFNGSNCSDAYIGGAFSRINGTAARYLAEISTSTGNVNPSFANSTSGTVDTVLAVKGHLLVGGSLRAAKGSGDAAMVSLSPATGKNDGFLKLNISGTYQYCGDGQCTGRSVPFVYNQQLSHSGTLDLAEGDFTSVGGLQREQVFMLNLATDPATVTGWTSPQFDGSDSSYPYRCKPHESFYIRSAAWSPDDSTVYTASTGNHPVNWNHKFPVTGLCDAVASFPATQEPVTDNWIEYAGCDSYYTVAADNTSVYAAGHARWAENPDGCNFPGRGAIKDYGLIGLHPDNGQLDVNANGKPVYTMARANGDDMLITSAGMWIASSNRFGSNTCTTVHNVSGICFLPYPG